MAVKDVFDAILETGKQVGSAVSEKTKEAGNYAKDAVLIANLKNQIANCREMINKNYVTLGEHYYKHYEENPEAEMVEVVRVIAKAEATIKALEDKIQEIKNAQVENQDSDSGNIDEELAKIKGNADD